MRQSGAQSKMQSPFISDMREIAITHQHHFVCWNVGQRHKHLEEIIGGVV